MNVIRVPKFRLGNVLPVAFAGLFPITGFGASAKHAGSTDSVVQPVVAASSSSAIPPSGAYVALLDRAAAAASGTHSVAIGSGASATADNSIAIGSAASAGADSSVALGSNAIANRGNTVSVGSAGSERQITQVAAGTQGTDVANVGQLNAGVQQAENWASSYTEQRAAVVNSDIQRVGNQANAGVAAAMAMAGLPQAYEAGKTMAAASAGTFRSQSGFAIGVSTISESGRWVYKATGSSDSRGNNGLTVGAGVQW